MRREEIRGVLKKGKKRAEERGGPHHNRKGILRGARGRRGNTATEAAQKG